MNSDKHILDRILATQLELDRTLSDIDSMIPSTDGIHRLWPNENVQAVIDSLKNTGGTIFLNPGFYSQILYLDFKSKLVIIRSDGNASIRGFLAKNRSGNIAFYGVNFSNPSSVNHIQLGVELKSVNDVPSGFTFINCNFTGGCRRGIAANCGDLIVEDCKFGNYFASGQDSQCIMGWNGARNHILRNCSFEAASENVMYGGSDAASVGVGDESMFPVDVFIERCTFTKNPNWKGKGYNVKCLLEMKNIKGITISDCYFKNSFQDAWAQSMAVMFKSANQNGTNPTARTSDVLFERNIIEGVGSYITLIGRNDGPYPSGVMRNIVIRNNLFHKMSAEQDGRALRIGDGPEQVIVDHNTFLDNRHSFIEAWGIQIPKEIQYTNNIAFHGSYGIFPRAFVPAVCSGNAIQLGSERKISLPPNNLYVVDARGDLSKVTTTDNLPVGSDIHE